ncbi:hypothetical protein [Nocardia jiangxiensis]|uniref:hypothetical protein n=1 Tax=Nocardia jiangxiensis TaxID=282685 RepID=UPI000317732B|nr:hypothetical protein [Nocardia jiangxiensis]
MITNEKIAKAKELAYGLKYLINDIGTGSNEADIASDLKEALPRLQALVTLAEDIEAGV